MPEYSTTRSKPVPVRRCQEDEALTDHADGLQYGSFVPSPLVQSPTPRDEDNGAFALPAPAIHAPTSPHDTIRTTDAVRKGLGRLGLVRSSSLGAFPGAEDKKKGSTDGGLLPRRGAPGQISQSPSQLRRLFSHGPSLTSKSHVKTDLGFEPFDLVRQREAEFYKFMDEELDKVESFYRMKEEQAGVRLLALKEQLHEMRNRRLQEITESTRPGEQSSNVSHRGSEQDRPVNGGWVRPIKAKIFPLGPNSKAFQVMPGTPRIGASSSGDGGRDYIRRPEDPEVSYRTAKRKLKLAIHEFYRGLELLKSYALLNRTAFRKLNKKFDKAVNARPPYRYMNEKVNKAWFVNSDVLEGHIKTVEDLYARYFERGNHKLAAGKLRSLAKKHGEHSGSAFQSGFLIGTGLVFSVQGAIYGGQLLFHEDPEVRSETSYLLQIYGGYFLMLVLFALFCIDCMIWTRNKINYPFIFEFDQRHHLDWRTLAEFPSFFLLLFGITIWSNFSRYGPEELYLYYPVLLIGVTAVIILLPFPIIAHRARKWFAYSHVGYPGPATRRTRLIVYIRAVASFTSGHLSCRISRLLSRRHILFPYLCNCCKSFTLPSQFHTNNDRISSSSSVYTPASGRTPRCATRVIQGSWAFWQHFRPYGGFYSASAATKTLATFSRTWSTAGSTQ